MSAKPVLGIVGGIGSGKSRVASLLAEMGGHVIDADRLGHDALRQPDLRDRIVAQWGAGVLGETGEVSRRQLAEIIFQDAAQRKELETIVLPYIGERIRATIAAAQVDPGIRFIVLDAAILLETGWKEACDRIVYVHAPRSQRLDRLTQRGWNEAELVRREHAQLPLAAKEAAADATIDNSGSIDTLRTQLETLLTRWTW